MKEYIVNILMVSLAILAPIQPMLIACGFLIVVDTITGVVAAHKRKESISSAQMRRAVTKLFIYQLAIISGFVLEKYLMGGILPVSKIVAGVIGMVEFKSILENASTIAGENILKLVMDKLGSKNAEKK